MLHHSVIDKVVFCTPHYISTKCIEYRVHWYMLTWYPEVQSVESQQFAFAVKVASSTLDCTGKSAASTQRGVIPPLHLALVGEHLESCVQFWAAPYQLGHAILQSVQTRAPKRVKVLAHHVQGKAGRTSTS